MPRLGRSYFNTPQFWAAPYVTVDPQTVGTAEALASITASVTASSVYNRNAVYVYGIKEPTYATRRGPATLILYGIEPGDVVTTDTKVDGTTISAGFIDASSDAFSVFLTIIASADITAVGVDAPVFYFTTPTVRERRFLRRHGLWDRMYLDRGLSILRFGTSYQQIDNPSTDQMESADALFVGGRTYLIDEEEAALLRAAGYGHWIGDDPTTPIDEVDLTQYGAGVYGSGPYGE